MDHAHLVDLLQHRAERDADHAAFTFHGPPRAAAARGPSAAAPDAVLTFAGLERRARGLAAALQRQTRPGDRVLIALPPGGDFIAAFFGCVMAGLIAVPAVPPVHARRLPRLQALALDSGAAWAIAAADTVDRCGPALPGVRWLSGGALLGEAGDWARPATRPGDTAFLQYTSGSTGSPKGVRVTHANVLANARAIHAAVPLRPGDTVVSWLPLHHDMGLVGKVLFPLHAAAHCVQMAPEEFLAQPMRWLRAVAEHRARSTCAPDFAYALCAQRAGDADKASLDLGSLEFALSGSEPVRPETLRRFAAAFAGCGLRARALLPVYGLAECTLLATACDTRDAQGMPASLRVDRAALAQGRAVEAADGDAGAVEITSLGVPPDAAQRLLVVDAASGRARPDGLVGEVWLQGPSVTTGYWSGPGGGDAQTFGLLSDRPGDGPWLRTGDLGFLRDGRLHLVGRSKDVMVFDGVNHHPQDVEASLAVADPAFRPGGGAAFAVETQDGARLVLLQEVEPRGRPRLDGLAARVRAELAEAHGLAGLDTLVLLKAGTLPRTTSGKVRRGACRDGFLAGAFEALWVWRAGESDAPAPMGPASAAQARMALLWQEVLGLPQAPDDGDFFRLGGHSLAALQLAGRVRDAFGVEMPLTELFEHPRLADLARVVARRSEAAAAAPAAPRPDPASRHEPFPLTDLQRAYWLGRDPGFALGGVAAHAYREIRVRHFDIARFTAALNTLIGRHGMLRAIVRPDGLQQALPEVPRYEPRFADLRGRAPEDAAERLQAVRDAMSHRVHAPHEWPLFEVRATRVDEEHTHLHLGLDLLILDAWSADILLDELHRLYQEPAAALPPLALSFRDCVLADRGADRQAALDHWDNRLKTLPPAPKLPLAADPSTVSQPRFGRRSATLAADRWAALRSRSAQAGVTPAATLLAAFAEVLGLWSRHPRFTLNLTFFNRPGAPAEVGRVIGDFTSLLLLEVDGTGGQATFAQHARRLQARLWADLPHSAGAGTRLLRRLARQGGGGPPAAMPVVFTSLLGRDGAVPDGAAALGGEVVHEISQTPQVWLDHQASERRGELLLAWDAVEALFPPGLLDEMFRAYADLVGRLADDASLWTEPAAGLLGAVGLPSGFDLQDNADAPTCAGESPRLHELFDLQARARPDHPALVCEDRTLSYRELRGLARQLADRLLTREGLQPGSLVAVDMGKGWEQAAAVLGVLYAGAAYLPLDPDWPEARRAGILAQARAGARLVQAEGPEWVGIERLPAPSPAPAGTPAQGDGGIAYVIYTSGSTGEPKGVAMPHRAAANTLLDMRQRLGLTPEDRVLALSSLGFDLSVFDLFGAFAAGCTVVVPPPRACRDTAQWLSLLREHRVSVWNSVPALAELLADHAESTAGGLPGSLRLALLSGDWIPLSLPGRLHALRPGMSVLALGGATEAAIWSVAQPVGEVDPAWRSIPYGRPLSHQRVHVLDASMRPRPVGVDGELYIGGAGLARGYLHDPLKTAERFVTHPRTGERLYRTGDWGRLHAAGHIEFLGREDDQVKLRGHRVELAEIENALQAHPGVARAAARLHGRHLVAYVVTRGPAAGQDGHDDEALRRHLLSRLPAAMLPSRFVRLEALPLSANGKVDRSALPAPAGPRGGGSPATGPDAPHGARQALALRLVRDTLRQPSLGLDDSLLDAGADSLDLMRVANAWSSALGWRPDFASLMAWPTVRGLLRHQRGRAGDAPFPATPPKKEIEL